MKRDYPRDKCVHQLFEEQVERTPEVVAVVFEGDSLSYRQLNTRANQLAFHLRSLGVGPDILVGLCVERSLDMVVALMGILKAGGAYVPLDPQYPAERLRFMLADAGCSALVTHRFLEGRLPVLPALVVHLDEPLPEARSCNPSHLTLPDHLAYVIYTSGSTGKPKGVAIEHHSVVSFLHWVWAAFTAEELSGVLAATSICFDISVFELFGPLCWGGRVILVNSALDLHSCRHRQNVKLLNTVPSVMQELLKSQVLPDSVVTVNLAGEPLGPSLVDALYERPHVRQVNDLYGPTETTIYSTWAVRRPHQPATIGRPIANTQLFILDPHFTQVPVGVKGELYIGGEGVARGYWKRPVLTAERFVPDPFGNDPAARLYRTGDRARWRADGQVEFLGRDDTQVKIRGFRIELGEIEVLLAGHPDVSGCSVVTRNLGDGENALAAFVVGREHADISAGLLRQWLSKILPAHMIPSRFFLLPALPLTPNGKVDRRALAKLEAVGLAAGEDHVPARNNLESKLAEIWLVVLRLDRIGIHDNFFDLGGDSLQAMSISSQVTRQLNVEVPLRWLLEHPTIARLAKQMESLEGPPQNGFPIEMADRHQPLPTSFAQQGLWFLQQTLPDPATYNEPVSFRLSGRVDRERVRRALRAILERHEILRTALVRQGDRLVQQVAVAHDIPLPWQEVNLCSIPPDRQPEALAEQSLREARRAFDLAEAPLWRAVWINLAENDHVMAFTFHHCIVDEWTMRLFFLELERLYAADGRVELARLPELPVQYADFAAWQRQRLTGDLLERQRRYWCAELQDLPPALELPADRARPLRPSGRGTNFDFQVPGPLATRLRELGREEGTTLFTVLLAAFQVWLHRYTGQVDVVVGTPFANRQRPEIQSLLGYFLNTLPIRVRLEGNSGFRQVLRQVRESLMGAFSHADLPFEQMVELTVRERTPGYQPLYQVMFVLVEEGSPAVRIDHATVEPMTVATGTSKNDLTLFVQISHNSLECRFEYATDLFGAETAGRMARHLTELLHSITIDPEKAVERLNLLPEAERQQILIEWNQTQQEYPRDKCVHQLFEEQVERTPEAVAVVFEGASLSYRQLNARANQLAHHLRSLGVGPDVLVGLCVERSLDMVVALLGILKAGGAYVPLDPHLPRERLAFFLQDIGAPLVLVERQFRHSLPAKPKTPHTAPEILILEDLSARLAGINQSNPPCITTSGDLAYVMYTSGTTGQPKGVMVRHLGIVRLLVNPDYVTLESHDVLLQYAPLAFDASTFEIWGSLLNGARLALPPAHPLDYTELGRFIVAHGVTTLWLTSALFHQMLDHAPDTLAAVRQLLAGGDVLSPAKVRRYLERPGHGRLINGYGPTENTTFTCCCGFNDADKIGASVPLGRPIAGTRVYILDDGGQPVPVGVPGEIHAGGDGVARGYLNDPELTAERFIADPFSPDQSSRLYKTGDLARYLPDGNLEFIGRRDHQVKIRGFRVELGEIEAALRKAPGVRECVAMATENNRGEKCLAAYLVAADPEAAPPVDQLREFLTKTLPDYMIPSAFVLLTELPLTASGKVDRKALPPPVFHHDNSGQTHSLPRTPFEATLAQIWGEVLNIRQVGIHDNFFNLGGHSLLAMQVVSRIRREFELDIGLRAIFESPTVEAQALLLLEKQADIQGFDAIDSLLIELEALSEEAAGDQLCCGENTGQAACGNTCDTAPSAFNCPVAKSAWFGRRRCNLLIVVNELFEAESFERVARQVRKFDPLINALVLRDRPQTRLDLPEYPTLTFSPALIRNPLAGHGKTFCGYPLSKSEEYRTLEKIGMFVPKWLMLTENVAPDLSGFHEYIVRKPDYGGKGAEVKIVRKERIRWKPIITQAAGTSSTSIIQEFIYTGPQPVSYRVNTLFGRVLYSVRHEGSSKPLMRKNANDGNRAQEWGPIVASTVGSRVSLNYDNEIILLGEAAARAFPDIPLLGVDIIREVPSGKLYILEANAIGYVWNFYAGQAGDYGFSFEAQFDGVRKAAYLLAEMTQQHAC